MKLGRNFRLILLPVLFAAASATAAAIVTADTTTVKMKRNRRVLKAPLILVSGQSIQPCWANQVG